MNEFQNLGKISPEHRLAITRFVLHKNTTFIQKIALWEELKQFSSQNIPYWKAALKSFEI